MRRHSPTNSNRHENLWLRNEYRASHPWCELCPILNGTKHETAHEIHHAFGGNLGRWDLASNLLHLCGDCHRWCEEHKTDGRILALLVKHREGILNQEEIRTACGMYVAGWLASHPPQSDVTRDAWQELSESC